MGHILQAQNPGILEETLKQLKIAAALKILSSGIENILQC